MDCIFCKIVSGEIPSKKVYEDDQVYAFHDIAPAAPVHILIVPKLHVMAGADEAEQQNAGIFGHIFIAIARIAKQQRLGSGYRVVTNVGEDAGQTLPHLHFHILAGAQLGKMA